MLHYKPHTIIILAFMLQNALLLQRRKVSLNSTLAHRQHLRHLASAYCRRLLDDIQYFLLTVSEFHLRQVSVKVSDIYGVGRCEYNGLELCGSGFENWFQLILIAIQVDRKDESFESHITYGKSGFIINLLVV